MKPLFPFLFLSTAVLCLGLQATLIAAPLFKEDFESVPKNQSLNQHQTLSLLNESTGQSVEAATAPFSESFEIGERAARYVDENDSENLSNLRINLTGLRLDPSLKTVLSFDYYNLGNAQQDYLFINDGSQDGGVFLNLRSATNQTRNRVGEKLEALPGTGYLGAGKWYRFELTLHPVDTDEDRFDLRVIEDTPAGGNVIIDQRGLPFRGDIQEISLIAWGTNTLPGSSGQESFFDNIVVEQKP